MLCLFYLIFLTFICKSFLKDRYGIIYILPITFEAQRFLQLYNNF